MKGLIGFEQLKIPLWIGFANNVISAKISVFGDASEATYRAVGSKRKTKSLRYHANQKNESGTLTKEEGDTTKIRITKFSFGNSSRRSSQEGAPHEHWRITYWSDSLVALGWIRGEPNRWRQFLRNQVETIQNVSKKEWWRHCPGLGNLADLAS